MSKARASMGSRTTIDSLYIFTNESLLHKETIRPVTLTSFESFVASCNIPMRRFARRNIADRSASDVSSTDKEETVLRTCDLPTYEGVREVYKGGAARV